MEQQLLNTAVTELIRVARLKTSEEQGVLPMDFYNWATDDVYTAGCDDGEIQLARKLLTKLGITW